MSAQVAKIPSAADLMTPLSLASFESVGRYQRARHLEYLQREVMAVLYGDWDILVAMAPPRHGKSEFLSRWVPTWRHSVYPSEPSILASYSVELARKHSRWVRDKVHTIAPWFGHRGGNPDVWAAGEWALLGYPDSGMKAAGVGGGITGRGSMLSVVDDPLKNAEQALSETVRKNQWEWFQTTLMTRTEPGGKCLVLACLVGETEVSVPGGSKPIRDIRTGDQVQTLTPDGSLGISKVRNHACVGHDDVFSIRLRSGNTVTGNGRHPFLVIDGGALRWVRIRDLRPGHRIVATEKGARIGGIAGGSAVGTTRSSWLRPIQLTGHMETGGMSRALSAAGASRSSTGRASRAMLCRPAGGCAQSTTTVMSGDLGRGQTSPRAPGGTSSSIGTVSPLISSMLRSSNRAASVRSVASHQFLVGICRRPGKRSSASITAIRQVDSGDCSATPAIWQPETLTHPSVPWHCLSTCDFTSDEVMSVTGEGVRAVYDIEVEGTGNFIANGLVCHNTRWHESDLLGMILNESVRDGLRVRECRLPALSLGDGDPLGRPEGEPLWPEMRSLEWLCRRRDSMEDYWWMALYQQVLTTYGHNEWPSSYTSNLLWPDEEWPRKFVLHTVALDPSVGKKQDAGDYSAICHAGFKNGYIWLDFDLARRPAAQMMVDLVDFVRARRPTVVGIESVAFQHLLGESYIRAVEEAGISLDDPVMVEQTVSKELRIRKLGFWLRIHRLRIRDNASGRLVLKQLREFPNGDHDDGPDAAEVAIRLLIQISDALADIAETDYQSEHLGV